MTIQDHSKISHSSTILTGGNGITLDTGGQIKSEEGYVPKIRKPYTISKQRERWTEEEHKRFLEALKQHGRAWRKIEEHVGTKTAVQIRSHAQKFFSKVVRESSDSNSVEPIDIPPPRPKRKPAHPYPRKLVSPAKRGTPLQEQSAKSASLHSSLDQENRSPTSVLSASDTLGSADSHILDGSTSPVSTCEDVKPATDMASDDDPSGQENASELDDEPVLMKLELVPQHEAFDKEGSIEADTSTKNLRLFGKILLVADPEKPSISSLCSSNPKPQYSSEGLASEFTDSAGANAENPTPPAVWYMNASSHSHPMEVGPSAPLSLWAFYRGMPLPLPFIPLNVVDVTNAESLSHQCFAEPAKVQKDLDPSSSISSEKCKQGFLPYKKSSSEIETQSPIADEVRRLHLCL